MITFPPINKKKMILLAVVIFVFTTVALPSVFYGRIASAETCATMELAALGVRDICRAGNETLLQVISNRNTPDFLILLVVGLLINIAASTLLSMIVFSLHHRLYAKS